MPAALYVMGHRNPDTDSICAAVGYTALLHAQGHTEAVAARLGVLRRETAYVLERFGVPPPVLVTDVRPRVADLMTSPAFFVHQDNSLYEVGYAIQSRGIRALPVVDNEGRLRGITGVEDFAQVFFAGLDLGQLDKVHLDLQNLVRALDGLVLVAAPERKLRDKVMVGAMKIDSMINRLEPDILLVMGDREDAQRAAIEFGIGALVITGGHAVSDAVIDLAREHQVSVIVVPHHTYTTVRLIHMSTSVRHIMRTEVPTCNPDDFIDDVKDRLGVGGVRSVVVIDAQRRVVGVLSRTNLLKQARRRLVLVDHNERAQSVAGIEEAEVVGVIDHHRVADFQTSAPPFMRLEPVGSTSTIVAKLFVEASIPMPRSIAGVLLAGILADTLLFRGPTTTTEDRRMAAVLARQAEVEMVELGDQILTQASDVSDRSAQQLLVTDFKDFSADGNHFGIGVIETTHASGVLARRAELLVEMERLRERGYTIVLFAVIDIVRERTAIFAVGHAEAVAEAFGVPLEDGTTLNLPGILSRKKQMVPLLGAISRSIGAH